MTLTPEELQTINNVVEGSRPLIEKVAKLEAELESVKAKLDRLIIEYSIACDGLESVIIEHSSSEAGPKICCDMADVAKQALEKIRSSSQGILDYSGDAKNAHTEGET